MKVRSVTFALLVIAACTFGQDPKMPSFEVASVKSTPKPATFAGQRVGCFGGPGTPDPGQYICDNATLALMAMQAYDLKPYQFPKGAFDDKLTYHVVAKVPQGTSKEQLLQMMQNLLAEQFKLAFHFEKQPVAAYHLVVAAGGAKFSESPPTDQHASAPQPDSRPARPLRDEDGFPLYPRRPNTTMPAVANGKMRVTGSATGLDGLARILQTELGLPVFNRTGLTGTYDFILTFERPDIRAASSAGDPEIPAPTIFSALEHQLGLRLEKATDMIDIFIVDRAEKSQ
jgi:uncharacterized protein (TIGR03435 family)